MNKQIAAEHEPGTEVRALAHLTFYWTSIDQGKVVKSDILDRSFEKSVKSSSPLPHVFYAGGDALFLGSALAGPPLWFSGPGASGTGSRFTAAACR